MLATQPGLGWRISRSQLPVFDMSFQRQHVDDYDDINGREVGRALMACGWEYLGSTLRIDALAPAIPAGGRRRQWTAVASAWAGLIQSQAGPVGLNLSYAVEPAHRGQGLALLLSCCAAVEYAMAGTSSSRTRPRPTFINIQCRTTNEASLATANSLGVPACPEAGFTVTHAGRDDVEYLGFREPIENFLDRARPFVAARLPGYWPGGLAHTDQLELSPQLPWLREDDASEALSLTESSPHQ
ncbi:hypothetical protein [Variovorax gossypii]|uniref:hypothetical protein n=1 Tax=uncultured Variovorax sp. TaxID=114708 RepID=UPI00261D115A|nr:hypothetical protein [uncultured Variovorax sp.]